MSTALPVDLSLEGEPHEEIVVVSVRGAESVNRWPSFRLAVDVPRGFRPPAVSTGARLRIASGAYERQWSLIVAGVTDHGEPTHGRSRLEFDLRHPLAKLALRRQRRMSPRLRV